jgi:hypothetical protein
MKLVNDWRDAYKWLSMHGMGLGFILSAAAGSIAVTGAASAWIGNVGWGVGFFVVALVFILSMAGRLFKQVIKQRKGLR